VVGTHRILSADIRVKALALTVIDEEQCFGAAHK
jgi:transcription-repair coupling factor (superfamily II helicase)